MGGFCTKTCTNLVSLALFGPFYTSHSATVLPVGVASFFGAPKKVRRKRVVRSFGCDVSARRKECKKRARFGAGGQLRQASTGLGQFQSTRHTPCAVLCRRHTDQAALGARCLLQFVQVIYARALGVKAAHGGLPGLRSTCAVPPHVPRRGPFGCYRIANERTLHEYIRLRAAPWDIGAIRGGWLFCPKTFGRNDLHDLRNSCGGDLGKLASAGISQTAFCPRSAGSGPSSRPKSTA
jgi:hypothetical protein